MITGPAAVAGLTFQDGLAAVSCVILAATPGRWRCWRLRWPSCMRRASRAPRLRAPPTTALVGCRAPLPDAETTYGALAAAQGAFGEVFKELVEVDPERGIPTRKRAPLAHFAGQRHSSSSTASSRRGSWSVAILP